jgi:hypothetical protein
VKRILVLSFACLSLLAVASPSPAASSAQACNVNAGPIWNQGDANAKCPDLCNKSYGPWNGQWWTTVPNEMSVCQCSGNNVTENAGPIWNQSDANTKCPKVCTTAKGTWTGQWWTTEPGKMSVCQCSTCTPRT